jgi:hypothetical protein
VRTAGWLKTQKAGLFLYIAGVALLLVYALGFLTNVYLFYAYGDNTLADFYRVMQQMNNILLWGAMSSCIFTVVLFALELHVHAAGVITLVIVLLVSALTAGFTVVVFSELIRIKAWYTGLDFSSLDRYIERGTITYTFSTITYDTGIVLCVVFFTTALFLAGIVIRNAVTVVEEAGNTGETPYETI